MHIPAGTPFWSQSFCIWTPYKISIESHTCTNQSARIFLQLRKPEDNVIANLHFIERDISAIIFVRENGFIPVIRTNAKVRRSLFENGSGKQCICV
jgi:hypothetical protein